MTVLEFLRLRRGLSKAEAARLVRMLLLDYALVERGLRTPSEGAASRLEAAFGYHPALLTSDAYELIQDKLGQNAVLG